MNDDWQPRPPVFPGEWLDEETSADAMRELRNLHEMRDSPKREEIMQALADDAQKLDMGYDLRRQTVQPGDSANRRQVVLAHIKKKSQARQTAELALADMRRKYWEGRGMPDVQK